MTTTAAPSFLVGLSFGSESMVAALRTSGSPVVLVQNEVSHMKTPCALAFKDGARVLGDQALAVAGVAPHNALPSVPLAVFRGAAFEHAGVQWLPEQVAGMLLGKMLGHAGEAAGAAAVAAGRVAIAVPNAFGPDQVNVVRRGAAIGGCVDALIVPNSVALAAAYAFKYRTDLAAGPARTVLLVDVGYAFTDVAVVEFSATSAKVLASAGEQLGSRDMDLALFAHGAKLIEEKFKGLKVAEGSRLAARLTRQCERAKCTLSTVPDAKCEVENVADDRDFAFPVSRSTFEELCAPVRARLTALLARVVGEAGVAPEGITAVELIGGGCRTPFVQEVITAAAGGRALSFTLDSTSGVALGAAYLLGFPGGAAMDSPSVDEAFAQGPFPRAVLDPSADPSLAAALAAEARLRAEEQAAKDVAAARNSLEAYIFEARAHLSHRKHGSLLPQAEVSAALTEAEDWLLDYEETGPAALEAYRARLAELDAKVKTLGAAFFAKLEEERVAKERALEREAAEAAAEAAANPEEPEDHDNRALRFPERMRIVEKNKDEANELFKGNNTLAACQRYAKALLHSDKFVGDLTDDQKAEIAKVKLALHLNCAMCFLKLDKPQKAAAHCDDALRLDKDNAKGLYRRAMAYEALKDDAKAEADVNRLLAITPEDPAAQTLKARIDARNKKRAQEEKSMYQRMFQ
jgi:heat shock protein 4